MNGLDFYRAIASMMYGNEQISVPKSFREQVSVIEEYLKSDETGIINTMLDHAIDAALIDYKYTSSNKSVADALNYQMDSLNENLIGKYPTGLRAFAKQYFIERWKGSSLILTNVTWDKDDKGMFYPTNMWVVKGRDIFIDSSEEKVLGAEKYYFVNKNGEKGSKIIEDSTRSVFVQKPFSSWAETYPTPFLISRGVYKNGATLSKYIEKGTNVISKAVSLLLLKKGNVDLAKTGNPNFVYDSEDIEAAKNNLTKLFKEAGEKNQLPVYATNFDTEIEQIIPKFEEAVKAGIYSPVEKRILSGLGLIDVGAGMGNNRESSLINPKPFISMITEGIEDFKTLMLDVAKVGVEKNRTAKTKNFIRELTLDVATGTMPEFTTNDMMNHFRSMYDRGVISKRTYIELNGGNLIDLTQEIARRKEEVEYETLMYPPVVQNNGQIASQQESPKGTVEKDDNPPLENTGRSPTDAINFTQSIYKTIEELPSNLDTLSKPAKKLWLEVFNDSLQSENDEDVARKIAWSVVKRSYQKDDNTGKWKRKEKSSIDVDDEIKQRTLALLEKKEALLDKVNKEISNENN